MTFYSSPQNPVLSLTASSSSSRRPCSFCSQGFVCKASVVCWEAEVCLLLPWRVSQREAPACGINGTFWTYYKQVLWYESTGNVSHTFHSVSGCRWQHWCCLGSLPAHRTLFSKGVEQSPVGRKEGELCISWTFNILSIHKENFIF